MMSSDIKRRDKIALFLLAVGLTFYAGAKHAMPTFSYDYYLADNGSYATNSTVHIDFTLRAQGLDLSISPVLVFAREIASTNAADWFELSPRRMYPAFPADYTLANATNYDYIIYVDYVPPPTVHTNGVWQMRGIELPDGSYAFPNTSIRKED